jgi:hypothetical protein
MLTGKDSTFFIAAEISYAYWELPGAARQQTEMGPAMMDNWDWWLIWLCLYRWGRSDSSPK